MNKKHTIASTRKTDVPYDPANEAATTEFWAKAIPHNGAADLRNKRGRPAMAVEARKEQIALRVDKDVLEWYRSQGTGWQTKMNAVLKAHRDAMD